MNIVQVVDSLAPGGAERVAVQLANTLAEWGYGSHLCTTRGDGPLLAALAPSVSHYSLGRHRRYEIRSILRFVMWLRSNDIHIVQAHGTALFTCAAARLLVPFKLLYHDHEGRSEFIYERWKLPYRLLLNLIDAAVAVNRILVHWAVCTFGSGVFVSEFLPNYTSIVNADRTEVYRRVESGKEVRVVHLAHFRPQKDHVTLVKALHIARKRTGVNIRVLMLGGYEPSDSYYREVVRQIKEHDMTENVSILGYVENAQAHLANSHVGVLSSVSEGFPLAILEYALSGLPVIATDVGACREMLENGNGGYLARSSDAEDLADKIVEALTDYKTALGKGIRLKERVTTMYGETEVIGRLQRIYRIMLAEGGET